MKKYSHNMADAKKRFWEKVVKKGNKDCWIFTGAKTPYGYGSWSLFGEQSTRQVAHRVAWKFEFGEIPSGVLVCHTCDNPPCVNPAHLFLGSHKDNSQDMKRKGRAKFRTGEKSPSAKLKEWQVIEIRRKYKRHVYTTPMLAKEFGISVPHVQSIVTNKKWRFIGH